MTKARVRVHRAEQPVRVVRIVDGEIVEGPAVWSHDKVPAGWEVQAEPNKHLVEVAEKPAAVEAS